MTEKWQGPTQGARLIEVFVKREMTIQWIKLQKNTAVINYTVSRGFQPPRARGSGVKNEL